MPRWSRWQVVVSALAVGAIGLQALAFCGVWVALAAAPDCCPLHTAASDAVVISPCCATVDQNGQTATPSAPIVKASDLRTITLPAQPPFVDSRVAYHDTLPVAARGHAPLRLPALLI